MIFITLPLMTVALVPIIALEAVILGRSLGLAPKTAWIATAVANALSTLVGTPLTWLALVVLEMLIGGGGSLLGVDSPAGKLLSVTWQAPWLVPHENELHWMIPAAALVLLAPFFLVSWAVETLVVRKFVPGRAARETRRAVGIANAATYCLLAAATLVWLSRALAAG